MAAVRMLLVMVAVALAAIVTSASASARETLRLSEAGVPVSQGTEVSFRLVLTPEGGGGVAPEIFTGSALQVGGGPLTNEAKVDGFTTNEGADGQEGWLVQGSVDAITLSTAGKATITTSGEAIANNETEGVNPVEPPPPALAAEPALAKWECFYPLPKRLTGTFSTSGPAVATGTTTAKTSKACHLRGLDVSFRLELLPNDESGPPLSASIVP